MNVQVPGNAGLWPWSAEGIVGSDELEPMHNPSATRICPLGQIMQPDNGTTGAWNFNIPKLERALIYIPVLTVPG
ncbi:MAG TPA: hypothetical protein VNK04_00035 [Gemmataceae bacterium]|nr:hypothetical protein [Gemmataceae bacterium]